MNDPPNDSNDDSLSNSKRGRKKGCNLELLNLHSGGVGGRAVDDSIPWYLDQFDDLHDSDMRDYSESGDSSEEEEEDLGGKEINCISDLQGN